MSDILITYKERFRRARYNLRRYTALLLVLAMLTTLFVNWQLHGVGISMTADYQCGETEHIHTDECYALYLTCGYEEGELMNAAEIEAAEAQLAVEQQNSAEIALCDDAPLQPATEWVPHTHTEDCYTAVQTLTCLEEEHTHGDDCFDPEDGSLLCDKFEHTHTDACYTTTYELACGLADGELVEQPVEQAPAAPALLAAQDPLPAENSLPDLPAVEPVYHHHTEDCYQKTLVCPLQEHRHTVACLRDPMEDIETEDDWLAATNVQLTGQWNTDLLAVAETQLGYKQSEKNFEIDESDGVSLRYYSRYGQFYNNPYGEWDVMFLAYCLKYAGVDRSVIPQRASVLSMRCDMSGMAWLLEADDTLQPQPGDIVIYQKYLTRTVAAESQADGAEEDLDDGFWADDFGPDTEPDTTPDTTPDAAPDTETGADTPDTAPLPEDTAAKPVVDADETNTAVPGDTEGTLLSALPLLPQEPAAAPDTAVMGVTPDTAEQQPGYTIGAFAPSAPTEDELAEEAPLTRTVTDGIPVDTVGIVREVDADLGTLTVISGDVHGEVATVELTLSELQGMIDVKAAQNSIAVALSPTRPSRAPAAAAATATGKLTMGVSTGKDYEQSTYVPDCLTGDYLASTEGTYSNNKGLHYQLVLNVPTSASFDGTGGLRTITVTLPSGLDYKANQTVAYLGFNGTCQTSVTGESYDTKSDSNFTASASGSTLTFTFKSLQQTLIEKGLTHLIVRFTANVNDSFWTNYPGGTKTYTCSAIMTEGGSSDPAGEATSSITLNGTGAKVSDSNVSLEYWLTNTTQEEQHGFYGPGKNEGAEWAYGTYKTQQIGYQLIVDLNAYETLPDTMTFTAQLPKGVTYRTNTASVVFAHGRSDYGTNNTPKYTVTKTDGNEWKLAHYFRSENDNDGGGIVADALEINGQTLTFNLKGFDEIDFVKLKNDTDGNNYKDLVLRFRVDFADEDNWNDLTKNKFTYETSVTSSIGENTPITKTTSMSLKRDAVIVQKSAQQILGTNRIRYAVVINPSANTLSSGHDLTLKDTLTVNTTGATALYGKGDAKLYEYTAGVDYLADSPNAKSIPGFTVVNRTEGATNYILDIPSVPDNKALVLVYEYTISKPTTGGNFELSNNVTLNNRSSTYNGTYTYYDTQNNLVFNARWLDEDGNTTTPAQDTINVDVYEGETKLGNCQLTATGKWQGFCTLTTYQPGQTLTLKTTFTHSEDYSVTYEPATITPGTPITITIKPAETAYELPSTGGCGTLPFTAVGGTLMLAALAYGIYLKRNREGRADR